MVRLRTIRSRLLLLELTGLGTVVLAALLVWMFEIDPALRLSAAQKQSEVAQRAAEQIDYFLSRRIADLSAAAEFGNFWQQDKAEQKQTLSQLLKLVPEMHEVSVLDLQGQERIRLSRLKLFTETDLRALDDDDHIRQALAGSNAIGPVHSSAAAEPMVSIAVPFLLSARTVGGVLKAVINLKNLWQSVAAVRVGQTGHLYVVDASGLLIAHPDSSRVLLGLRPALAKVVASRNGRQAALGEVAVGESGNAVIATRAAVRQSRWTVIAEEPVESALADARRLKSLATLLLFIAAAGALFLTLYFSRRVSGPIRRLARGAEVISLGDLEHRIVVNTGDELQALAEKFNQMASTLRESHRDLERRVDERTRDLAALYAALGPLQPSDSLAEVLQGVIDRLMEASGAHAALIRLKEGSGAFACLAHRGFDEFYLEATATLIKDSAGQNVFASAQPLLAPDIASEPRLKAKMQLSAGFRSCAILPLIVLGKSRGIIHLASRSRGFFNRENEARLMAIARQMSIAIENHELFVETHRNLERIRALHEIDKAIAGSLDLRTVLDVLLDKIALFLPYPAATAIRLINHASGDLEPMCSRNLDEEVWKQSRGGRGVPNLIVASRMPVSIVDVQRDPRSRDREFFVANGLVSFLGVPLIAKDEILGVLSFYTKCRHEFTEEEIEFLATLADRAAIAIHNSKLYGDLQAQADALEKSNHVKSEFLGIMSHELTTPITAIMGYAALIQEEVVGPANDDQKRSARVIRNKGTELLAMIRGIIEATKLESGGAFVELGEVDSRLLVEGLRAETEVPSGKELRLEWHTDESLVPVATDEYKLKQVLKQLIDNAIKFTPEGTITISAMSDPEAQALRFEVADSGVGIAPDLLPVIFERFRQADSSDTRSFEGIGLGLYLAKKYCELLGADLTVESEVGRGSTFAITLPWAASSPPASSSTSAAAPSLPSPTAL